MMRKLLCVMAVLSALLLQAQPGMYRHYTQMYPPISSGWSAYPQKPVATADGGYLLNAYQMTMGFESPGGLGNGAIIKTDSSFVPLWKKNYSAAIPLPTGGIILIKYNSIEKVTASGVQIWMKQLTTPVVLTDAVVYGNKIRFVGNVVSYAYVPATTLISYTSDGFSMLTDTSGNYISHKFFYSSLVNSYSFLSYNYRASAEFSKIKRDAQGNFIVYSTPVSLTGIGSNMAIAKFDTSFTFVWGKSLGANFYNFSISDIDILPNGRIFAAGVSPGNGGNSYTMYAALFKLSSQGNLLGQSYFKNRSLTGELAKKSNGNYVLGIRTNDSTFMLETDTSMNVLWHKFVAKGSQIGGSVIRNNNRIYTPIQYGNNMVLLSNDINGNSCSSYSMSYTKPTSTLTLTNFTLTPMAYTTALVSGTVNNIGTQSYVDSCKCPVFIALSQNNLCVGNTGTIGIIGTGNLSWYSTATGNSFLQSGPQFTYSSNSPTTVMVYAQDSACTANPARTGITINVYAQPTISFNPPNPIICMGSQVFVTAMGAVNYTWSNGLGTGNIQNLNPLVTTIYTVTGSSAPNCSNTKTVAVTVAPIPVITANSTGTICFGQTATISASGGTFYTWSNGQTLPVFTVSPNYPGYYTYNVTGSNLFCNGYASATLNVLPVPSLTALANPSVICLGKTATLSVLGASTYMWSNGYAGSSMLVTPSSGTSYIVTGANGACISSTTVNVQVQTPTVLTTWSSASLVCAGTPISFSVTGASNYTWSSGATAPLFTSTAINGANTYSVKGLDGVCTVSAQINVQGAPIPTIVATANPPVMCLGVTPTISAMGASSYSWSNGFNVSSFTLNPVMAGTSIYSVAGNNGTCGATAQVTVTALPLPTISISTSSASLCAGSSVSINANGASAYLWSNGSSGAGIIASPSVSTVYSVQGTLNNCSSTASVYVPVQALPVLSLSSSGSTVCIGTSVNFSVSGANSFTWSNGSNASGFPYVVPLGISSLSVTGSIGICSATEVISVQGITPPALAISGSPTLLCVGSSATISATGANSYTWGNAATASSIVITPLAQQTLSLYGLIGACGNSSLFTLNVLPSPTVSISANQPGMCLGEFVTLNGAGANSYTWNTGANTTSLLISPLVTLTYTLKGTGANGCSNTAYYTQVVNLCLDADSKATLEPYIEVYPNPNNGNVFIRAPLVYENSRAQLFGVDGKGLMDIHLNTELTFVDMSAILKGMYVLRIEGTNYSAKIMRE